jgi:hypothetical protein
MREANAKCDKCALRLYGYQPIFKKSKTDPAAGIAMGALAVKIAESSFLSKIIASAIESV